LVIARDFFEKLGGFERSLNRVQWEDYEFTLRCAAAGTMGVVLTPTVNVRKHASNVTADRLGNAMGRLTVLKYVRSAHGAAQGCQRVVDDAIAAQAVGAADAAFVCGEFEVFRDLVRETRGEAGWKLYVKAAVARLPRRIALPVSRTLCRVGTVLSAGPSRPPVHGGKARVR
jgi:hypothetical protein